MWLYPLVFINESLWIIVGPVIQKLLIDLLNESIQGRIPLNRLLIFGGIQVAAILLNYWVYRSIRLYSSNRCLEISKQEIFEYRKKEVGKAACKTKERIQMAIEGRLHNIDTMLFNIIPSIARAIGFILFCWWIHRLLVTVLLVLLTVVLALFLGVIATLKKNWKKSNDLQAGIDSAILSYVENRKGKAKIEYLLGEKRSNQVELLLKRSIIDLVGDSFQLVATIGIIVVLMYLYGRQEISIGGAATALMYFDRFYGESLQLCQLMLNYLKQRTKYKSGN